MENNELRFLSSGKLATMRALLHALIETHPDRAALKKAFEQKAIAFDMFICDYQVAIKEEVSGSQSLHLLREDMKHWLAALEVPHPA